MSYKKINDFFSNNINLSDINILCIGDVILDTFFECEANRISSENPVPNDYKITIRCFGWKWKCSK